MVLSEETTRPVDDLDPPFLPEPTVLVRRERATPTVAGALEFADRWRRELFGLCAVVVAGIVGLAYVARVEPPADPLRAQERDRLSAFAPLVDDVSSTVETGESGAGPGGSNSNRPADGPPQPLTAQGVEREDTTTPPAVRSNPDPTTARSTTTSRPGTTASSVVGSTTVPPGTDPPTTVPPETDPPTTLPPETDPPTVPPTTRPPTTLPPTTLPPTTLPPTTTVPPGSPVARSDAAETEENKDVKIKVLENDDPGSASFDEDSLQIVGSPAQAEEYRVHDDHVHYKSVDDFEGVDSMTYRICNDDGLCDLATIVITVVD